MNSNAPVIFHAELIFLHAVLFLNHSLKCTYYTINPNFPLRLFFFAQDFKLFKNLYQEWKYVSGPKTITNSKKI